MLTLIFVLTALSSHVDAPQATTAAGTPIAPISASERFANRREARIPFARDVRNFQVKREDNDDIIYLETRRDTWFRSEITCMGIGDPRDAHGLVPHPSEMGIDSFSRITLVSFGSGHTQCSLNSLIALTPQEAVELKLVRAAKLPNQRAAS